MYFASAGGGWPCLAGGEPRNRVARAPTSARVELAFRLALTELRRSWGLLPEIVFPRFHPVAMRRRAPVRWFAPRLGDGRAAVAGEVVGSEASFATCMSRARGRAVAAGRGLASVVRSAGTCQRVNASLADPPPAPAP